MTNTAFEQPNSRLGRRVRHLVLTAPVAVTVVAVLGSALEARSLLIGGVLLLGWSQLVGL